MYEPYPFQHKIINDIKTALREGQKSPVIVSPTGSGKTIMFSHIANGAKKKGNRVLIITHKIEILEQTMKKLFSYGIQCGQIRSGRPMTRDKIQVGMVLTLNNRLQRIHKPDLIICDEAHHFLETNTYGKALKYFKDVPSLHWTATPERLSGEGLGIGNGGFCDSMILGPSISDLVNDGYLAYPAVFKPAKEINENFKIKRGDFDTVEQEKTFSRKVIVGDVIEHYKKHFNGAPVVCFCVSIKHAQFMADVFNDNGFRSMAVYSGISETERRKAFSGLETGEVQILTNCSLVDEGVDIPNVAGVILLRKTRSLSKYLQMVGRALRTAPGKDHAIILDHANNYSIHGHPLADRDWSLDHGKRNHKKDKVPKTTSCPKCYGIWPGEPKKCPDCGFIFSDNSAVAGQQRKMPEQIAGELIDALPENIDPMKIKDLTAFINKLQKMNPKTRQKAMIAKAFELQDKAEIAALTKAIGYKRGWTDFVWRNIMNNRN